MLCSCPWWKVLKKEDEEVAHKTREQFMFVPKWLAASAVNLNHGYLTPFDGTPPRWGLHHLVGSIAKSLAKPAMQDCKRQIFAIVDLFETESTHFVSCAAVWCCAGR